MSAVWPTVIVAAALWALGTAQATAQQRPGAPPIRQQDAGPREVVRLTVADALARGLEASHRLAELRARQAAAAAIADVREAADDPQVTWQAGYTRTNHVDEFGIPVTGGQFSLIYPDVPDNYRTRLDLQWPIYTGGRADALTRAARSEASAAESDVLAARADLRLEITRAFWALLTARESARVVEEALNRVAAHLDDVRNRLKVGLVPPNDVLSVEAQHSRQRLLLIEAQNASALAASDLRRLTGLDPETPIELDASLDQPPAIVEPPAALVQEARRARAERQGLERRVESADERRTAATAGPRPVVVVAGGYDYANPNPRIFPRAEEWKDSWDLTVNVSWSLWDGGRGRAELAEATANRRAAEARLHEFDTVLDVEVRQRRLDLESSLAAIAAAVDGVRSAAEARRVVADRFQAGVATSTEVLDAQVALLQAELERTRALASARLAEARLMRALGR